MSEKVSWSAIVCAVISSLLLLSLAGVPTVESSAFGTIAEALTSETQQQGIKVGYRMFSLPTFEETCAKSKQPAKLIARKAPVTLYVGEWFSLDRLVILAMDASGQQLDPVPISLEVEGKGPPLLNLQSDMIAEARVLPIRAGRFRFRARAICHDISAEVLIQAIVRKPRRRSDGGRITQ